MTDPSFTGWTDSMCRADCPPDSEKNLKEFGAAIQLKLREGNPRGMSAGERHELMNLR
jgi:hypothetical protein